MIVSVMLQGDGKISFVGGREKQEDGYHYGLSVFYNDKYILNFVIINELQTLLSNAEFKAINDLGYILYTTEYDLVILKEYGTYNEESEFINRVNIRDNDGYTDMYVFSCIKFKSRNKGDFCKAIKLALENPEEESNLYTVLSDTWETVYI